MRHSTQEITTHKIEMASGAICAENARRKKFNKKRPVKHDANGMEYIAKRMPMLSPTYQEIGTRMSYDMHGNKGKIAQSKKFLVGKLGRLCQVMRDNNIAYPWRD
jgi:hypothetical protein